ncbi:hypothetical protein CHS0354_012853 [Potamilus streckersoni]|uniref:Intermediate filament protein n=1 Tax=Potamilus streckersoni TaxID=2493646 RepID=A0AAE0SX77_9BIVA|nr:hypothetical protein CHS0354_012853 [Potamilus streckersoni]
MSQSSVTEKRTVITTSSSSSYDDMDTFVKPNIGTRATNIISRSSANPLRSLGGSGGSVITRTVEYGYGHGMSPGSYGNISSGGAQTIKQTREKEKKDMQDLNERFAGYIEKVRFLEAQNRKLGNELDELRGKWGKETGLIKQMYEAELNEARKLIDDLSKDKASLEIKASSLHEQMSDIQRQLDEAKKYRQIDRDQINKLNQQLADYESEINMLRRSLASLETDRERDRSTIQRLQMDVDKLRIDLNNETLAHLDAENRRQTLEEEIEFLKKVHEQELKELAALAYRDTTAENREFWKNELGQAIREIQHEYDSKVDQIRGDLESFYNLKIQEFRTGATKQNMEVTHVREENKKLIKQMTDLKGRLADLEARNAQLEKQYQDLLREYESKDADHALEIAQYKEEISKLRAEMEGILAELQSLMDAKLSLELEIAAYRKLLECEENRLSLKQHVETVEQVQSRGGAALSEYISGFESKGDSQVSMKMMRGEVSAKTTYQRTSTGPIAISEVSPEGKFIVLENTSSGPNRREVNLDGWKIKRTVDGKHDYIYPFRNFTLKAGKKVKILARGSAAEAGLNDLVFRDEDTWGVGSQVTTVLINEKDEICNTNVENRKCKNVCLLH